MRGYVTAMRNYAKFKGRASRAEFWQFAIITWLILLAAYLVLLPGPGKSVWPLMIVGLIALAHALPYFAALARRLHDADISGWWVLIGLIPGVGLALLIPAVFAGTPGPNRFGDDPTAAGDLHAGHPATAGHPSASQTEPQRRTGPHRGNLMLVLASFIALGGGVALVASMADAADVELEVRSHLDSNLFDRDPLIGAFEVINVGGPVTLTDVTINRDDCRLSFYQLANPDDPGAAKIVGMPSYFAFTDDQRDKVVATLKQGVTLNPAQIDLNTGDSAAFTAPSVGRSPAYVVFSLDTKIETGKCGRVLVNMRLHSTDGDLYYEW